MTVPKTSAPSPSTLASTPCASNVGEGKAEPVAPSPEPASSSSARSPSLNECSLATVCTRAQHIPPEELSASRLAARGLYDSYLARIRPPRPATNGKRRSAHSGTNQRDTEASLSSVSAKDDASISGKSSPTTTTSAESCTSKDTPKGSSAEGTELCPSVKGPATPRTRERLRLRYAEKAREKTAEMYRKAIVLAHEREQTEGQRHRAKRVVEFRIHYSTSVSMICCGTLTMFTNCVALISSLAGFFSHFRMHSLRLGKPQRCVRFSFLFKQTQRVICRCERASVQLYKT